ncbi:MAG TPA: NAD(P)-dependent oxidoreductase, partial [Rhodothermales bacterium]
RAPGGRSVAHRRILPHRRHAPGLARRPMTQDGPIVAYAGVRVLVLGASGFIGRWVARMLTEAGADLHLTVRDAQASERVFADFGVSGRVLESDFSDQREVQEVLRDVRPSITFNLAGYGVDRSERDERLAQRINADFPAEVGTAAGAVRDAAWPGQDVVHVGSALEYGEVGGDLNEETEPNPTTLYGRTKLEGTLRLRDASRTTGARAVTARLFTVYGPGEHDGRLLPSILAAHRSGESLPLTEGLQKRDFTYVEDVAEGLLRLGLAEAEPGEAINLATGRLTTVRQFAETAADVLGMPADRLQFGSVPVRSEEMAHDPVSIRRLEARTGWRPTTGIREGIALAAAFMG